MCVGVGCENKDIKSWCKSKHQKDPITDECLPLCGPCSGAEVRIHPPSIHSTIFSDSDPPPPFAAGTDRGRMRSVRQMRPERVEALQDPREGGRLARSVLQALLRQGGQTDQEGGKGGLIPLFTPDPTAASPPHHDTNTAPVTRHVHPAKTRHVHNH